MYAEGVPQAVEKGWAAKEPVRMSLESGFQQMHLGPIVPNVATPLRFAAAIRQPVSLRSAVELLLKFFTADYADERR